MMRKIALYVLVIAFPIGCLFLYIQLSSPEAPLTSAILEKATRMLSDTFSTPIIIRSSVALSEPDRRNLVVRLTIKSLRDDSPDSVIFKRSLPDPEKKSQADKKVFDRFAREWAGLEFMGRLSTEKKLAPQYYGGNADSRFILLEDLGEKQISIQNSLLSNDARAATKALQLFMKSLATLHGLGYGRTDEYRAILKRINPAVSSWQDDLAVMQDTVAARFKEIVLDLGMTFTRELQKEVQEVFEAVIAPGPFTTFIHGDCCPDNTFYDESNQVLFFIDFEWGSIRSALLDGTYLRMSMPNCWGGDGAIPDRVIESLEVLYRQELARKIPAASNDNAYYDAYAQACAYWMIKNALLIPQPEEVRPRVLSRLQAFVTVATKYDKMPHLRAAVQQILQKLKIKWPHAKPLELYRAYEQSGAVSS